MREFWARRWNLAFSEMARDVAYRPLARRGGRALGLAGAFGLSGLLHEMAISVPVRAGFGLPLLYFCLQGALVPVEDALARRGMRIAGPAGRAWALAWVCAPALLLFHPPFLSGVVLEVAGVPR